MNTRVALGATFLVFTPIAHANIEDQTGGPWDDFKEGTAGAKLGTVIFNEVWGRDHGFVLPLSPTFDSGGKQLFDILHPEPTPKPTPDEYWRSPDDTKQSSITIHLSDDRDSGMDDEDTPSGKSETNPSESADRGGGNTKQKSESPASTSHEESDHPAPAVADNCDDESCEHDNDGNHSSEDSSQIPGWDEPGPEDEEVSPQEQAMIALWKHGGEAPQIQDYIPPSKDGGGGGVHTGPTIYERTVGARTREFRNMASVAPSGRGDFARMQQFRLSHK